MICNTHLIVFLMLTLSFSGWSQVKSNTELEGDFIEKSLYAEKDLKHSTFYNTVWGIHYRQMYVTPIRVPSTDLSAIHGGLTPIMQVPEVHGILMKNAKDHHYLLRILGGSTTFLQSSFFRETYNKDDFKDTYLDKFIGDAYTITNPYSFLVADYLAGKVNLISADPEIFYIRKCTETDTITDGSSIADRLVAVFDLKTFNTESKILSTEELLDKMQESKSYFVNQEEYIRERLLAMLIGDWNKVPDNWRWYEHTRNDSLVYTPIVIDRNHAFTKVDGILMKPALGVFNLKCIADYSSNFDDLRNSNSLSLELDATLTSRSDRNIWVEQAQYIKQHLTDAVIDTAFDHFPKEIRSEATDIIKDHLKKRLALLAKAASDYYDILQKTPVVIGTKGDDRLVIEDYSIDSLSVSVYAPDSESAVYRTFVDKKVDELWVYGLEGNDSFEVRGDTPHSVSVLLVGGKGQNHYKVDNGRNVRIVDYKSHDTSQDSLGKSKVKLTNIESVHAFDYKKRKYSSWSFTPMGIYDSDLGLSLGAYLTNTMYAFKRMPYTYRHRIGYNYQEGFSYLGLFPPFDERYNFIVSASVSTPSNFYNFFGFGNETPGYKDESNNYNRVGVDRYNVTPSLYLRLDDKHRFIGSSSFELFRLRNKYDESRYINQVYENEDSVFRTKTFVDLRLTYEIERSLHPLVPKVGFSTTLGWKLNIGNTNRNFTYLNSNASLNLRLSDRLTLATQLNAQFLFTDKYEFYQAATVKLRGFRENRFIGKQSFYQFTDLRLDLGRLENPFTPLLYGVFLGFDHGRVWLPEEDSRKWHTSYGGGLWLTFFKQYTGKFSYFGSKDGGRFYIGLGLDF